MLVDDLKALVDFQPNSADLYLSSVTPLPFDNVFVEFLQANDWEVETIGLSSDSLESKFLYRITSPIGDSQDVVSKGIYTGGNLTFESITLSDIELTI